MKGNFVKDVFVVFYCTTAIFHAWLFSVHVIIIFLWNNYCVVPSNLSGNDLATVTWQHHFDNKQRRQRVRVRYVWKIHVALLEAAS